MLQYYMTRKECHDVELRRCADGQTKASALLARCNNYPRATQDAWKAVFRFPPTRLSEGVD
jgi:hypothetical protein